MIIQHYDYALCDRRGLLYEGDTYFGFFSQEALAQQVGIRDAELCKPTAIGPAEASAFPYPTQAPFPDDMLRMVDEIVYFDPAGGTHGLGLIKGRVKVRPDDWFFAAHFYQDPVSPGSLGLESFLQLLKVYATERFNTGPGRGRVGAFQCMALGQRHSWLYRGQILPTDGEVSIEAVITHVSESRGMTGGLIRADGYLSVDGRVIYQMQDFALSYHYGHVTSAPPAVQQ